MMSREQPKPKLDSHHRKNADRSPAATVIISDSSESSDGSDSDDQEWPIKCILRETDTEYLIDWEGPYDPTWEPKENASELAIQVWNRRKARRSSELNQRPTRKRTPKSPSVIEVSSLSPEANIGPEDHSPFDNETEQSSTDSDNYSKVSSSLFVRQDGLSEIVDSLQSQYIEASGCFYGTASPPRSFSDCSPPLEAVSTNSRSQATTAFFEYISESSAPPEYLQPGEWDDDVVFDTQQRDPTCDSKADSVSRCSSHRQYSAEINSIFGLSYPNTPGLGLSSKVTEIAETPAQPPGLGADLSRFGSFSIDNTPSYNNLTFQPPESCGSVIRDCEFVQSTYLSSIPETNLQQLSQYPEELSAEGLTRQVLSSSNLVEEPSAEIMEDKEPKSSDPSLSDAPLDRYSELPGSTPVERIRNAWAQLGEENQSELSQTANAVETPSSVGDIEASIPVSVPETTAPLSVRADTDSFSHSHTAVHHGHSEPLLPPSELAHGGHMSQPSLQTIHPSALTVTGMDEVAPGSVHLGPSEFAVTLPMDSRVKDDYERVLSDAATNIRQFFDSFQSNSQISEPEREVLHSQMREVVVRLSNVSTHPDLNISDHLKDPDPDLAKEAAWAEYSSAKFLLLGHLMEIVGTHELHLILAVQDEKKQAVLERYLQGKGFAYTKPREEMGSILEVSLAKGSLSFGIHSSETARELYKPPSAIFALDSYFRPKSPSIQHIRTTYARNGNLLPVIWFLVANTSEHIERCLPESPEPDRLRLLVHYIARLHDEVGDLQDDALGVHEDAEEILGYLLDRVAGWPLPTIEPLNLVSLEELECDSSASSDEAMQPTQKRTLEDEPEEHSSKRARVGTQENSQLTESTKPPSQTLDRDLQSLERNLVQMKHIHATEKAQLQAELARANSRFQEMEKALGILQHRYESRTNELHATRQERDRVTETKPSLEQRVEKQKETISSLKEERTELKRELDEARQALKDGGGSSAELETAREEIRRLAKENSNLERKAEFEKNQAEYTREQYQTASTSAAQSGTENRRLATENEKLKRKAESNAVQLCELHMKDDSVRHLARIEELELILATRDEFLRRKEDELREIRKNRPSTRSTSTQPRSPKWAGSRPTSPGVGHNGNGNGLGGRGSALRYSSEMPF
ncbi:Histone deacetylase complex subunit 2/3 [Penicillium concentricum]|uniref:Histone deacetylase complex subunit 2/3 n=1 Tax=Penicillium concentricum TaxID=293559 RepID=A0A9W9RTB7_9EURO|nr:Histone deacetylase complex subunit 2/3 [Penicillium concentricum]KAJ5365856.1 Histone deacetylase complex subunit 2/3 [Penicillium concentricum]